MLFLVTKIFHFPERYRNVNTKTANEKDECPLGKLFLPWITFALSPEQLSSCTPSESKFVKTNSLSGQPLSGQHLKAKSGLGLPTVNLITFVMTPFKGSNKVMAKLALITSSLRNVTEHFWLIKWYKIGRQGNGMTIENHKCVEVT